MNSQTWTSVFRMFASKQLFRTRFLGVGEVLLNHIWGTLKMRTTPIQSVASNLTPLYVYCARNIKYRRIMRSGTMEPLDIMAKVAIEPLDLRPILRTPRQTQGLLYLVSADRRTPVLGAIFAR